MGLRRWLSKSVEDAQLASDEILIWGRGDEVDAVGREGLKALDIVSVQRR
jgi:hypothetical protein